jgi:putative heme-binding domain-containing protein
LTLAQGRAAIDELLTIANSDPDPGVRAQAIRATADLADPILAEHRLDATRVNEELAARLATLPTAQDPRLLLEVTVALGRLRWSSLPTWPTLTRRASEGADAALRHAAMQALRRCQNWPAILKLLDAPTDDSIRAVALRALADQYEPTIVDGLIGRLQTEHDSLRQAQYADLLTRVHQRPGPWVYWGYRPPPRPANTAAWERTDAIASALDRVLNSPNRATSVAVLLRMQREKIPIRHETLGKWLDQERQADRVATILTALGAQPHDALRPRLAAVITSQEHTEANRMLSLDLFAKSINNAEPESLLQLAQALEDGPVLAAALRQIPIHAKSPDASLLLIKVQSPVAQVRAAAIEALAELKRDEARQPLLKLLSDTDVAVRRAAATAAGKLGATESAELLLKLATTDDPAVRRASFDSLRSLRESRAVTLAAAALSDHHVELQALQCLCELGGPEHAVAITDLAKRSPSAAILNHAVRALAKWKEQVKSPDQQTKLDRAVAEIQGASGTLVRWFTIAPLPSPALPQLVADLSSPHPTGDAPAWSAALASAPEARVALPANESTKDDQRLAFTDVIVTEPTDVEFLGSSSGRLQVWLNGLSVFQRDEPRRFQLDSDRFSAKLASGDNRIVVAFTSPANAPAEFHLRFRRKSAAADHERLIRASLNRPGNAERGKKVLFEIEKSLCLKCHRFGDQGETTGPELTGIGSRFSRIHITESLLQPSRTVAPSFHTVSVLLKDGTTVSGVKVNETDSAITLADNQAQKHTLAKSEIDQQRSSPQSTMPDGLEKRLTENEFVDLIAFLANSKEN